MQPTAVPHQGARYRVLSGINAGKTARVLSVRESHPNDPVVTATVDGLPVYWRPAWGVRGMPQLEALPRAAH